MINENLLPDPSFKTFNFVDNSTDPEVTVVSRELTSNVVTLSTDVAHGFVVGTRALITGVDSVISVTTKSRTLTTVTLGFSATTHQFVAGDSIVVNISDPNYDGTYTVASSPAPSTTEISYLKTSATTQSSTAASGDISLETAVYDGLAIVSSTPTAYTFTYSVEHANLASISHGGTARAMTGYVVTSADSFMGGTSLQVTRSGAPKSGVITSRNSITGGNSYTASVYVKVPEGYTSGGFAIKLDYYNSSDVKTTNVISSTTTVTNTDGWVRLSATKVAASNDSYARVSVYQVAQGAPNEYVFVDAIKLENSTEATQYTEQLTQAQENDIVNTSLTDVFPGDIETKPYITGLKLEGDISINGLVLNTIDENKVVWICTDLDGWWTLPAPEVPNIPRGLDDGAYDVRGRWLPREITLQGSILPPKPEYAPAARQRLMEALNLVYTGGWLKVNEDPLTSAYVRVTGQPEVTSVNARGRIDFTVQLRAGDPVKYSWNDNATDGYYTSNVAINTVRGSMSNTTITNVGNTNTAPIFSITGPMTAPAYIKNVTTGKTLKIVKDLRPNTTSSAVTKKVRVSGISTLTTGDTAHKFIVGDVVTVAEMGSGTTDPHYQLNGDKIITAVSGTTFSFADPGVNVLTAEVTSNVVTLTTDVGHNFTTGEIYVSNLGAPFDGTYTIASASGTSITYNKVTPDTDYKYEGNVSLNIDSADDAGTATLKSADTLEIDTYNTTVLYRGLPDAARSTIDAGVDWIKLEPGQNVLRLEKSNSAVTPASMTIKYKSGWIG